ETVPSDYCLTVMEQAHQAWDIGAPCAQLGGGEYAGDYPGAQTNQGFNTGDGLSSVGFNDPENQNDPGVLAANVTWRQPGPGFLLNGVSYQWADNSDVVFNNDVDFA